METGARLVVSDVVPCPLVNRDLAVLRQLLHQLELQATAALTLEECVVDLVLCAVVDLDVSLFGGLPVLLVRIDDLKAVLPKEIRLVLP